ncbi:hypothetical protein [Halobacillus sp. BBL2006]|uniref:hypothetical protein n=1 Tax=Halobacillus sp. BBL2006 TaxID=1543706 RepID=UPI0005430EC1|nr:hypothetical protein [Halobacillus sp. BBL2006]KHE72230.1 hypothetical protein LD39_05655 [Halobacillus sp. BBL2006]
MNISVLYEKKKIGEISYSSLPAFRLYCEDQGFITFWHSKEKNLVLSPALSSKRVLIKGSELYENSMKLFLKDSGLTVVDEEQGEDLHLRIEFSTKTSSSEDRTPQVTFYHHLRHDQQRLKLNLYKELKDSEFHHQFVKMDNSSQVPLLKVSCTIPQDTEQEWIELLSMMIASAVLRYFQIGKTQSMLSCLPIGITDIFSKVKSSPHIMKQGETTSTKNNPKPTQPSVPKDERNPKQPPSADVYFDYTIFFSGKKDRLMTHGKLTIKNASEIPLHNPVICLKVQPAGCLEVRGQILPPNLVEGLGVHSEEGTKGWKFASEDWLEVAEERGEYWIGPIQRVTIPGNQSLSLDNLQFVIKKPEEGQDVTVRGFVYFNEDNVKFSSSNKVSVKFHSK